MRAVALWNYNSCLFMQMYFQGFMPNCRDGSSLPFHVCYNVEVTILLISYQQKFHLAHCNLVYRSFSVLLFFAVYEIYKKNHSFSTVYSGVKFLFFSVQNCQLFLFKNK